MQFSSKHRSFSSQALSCLYHNYESKKIQDNNLHGVCGLLKCSSLRVLFTNKTGKRVKRNQRNPKTQGIKSNSLKSAAPKASGHRIATEVSYLKIKIKF